jgi:CRISPR/Cas system CSM-associated protein Csm2 small subunit
MTLEMFHMLLGVTISAATIITITATGVRWLVRHYFDDIKKELKPNHGSSIKDQVNRMEIDIADLKNQNTKGEEYHEKLDSKIDKLTEIFIDYIAKK